MWVSRWAPGHRVLGEDRAVERADARADHEVGQQIGLGERLQHADLDRAVRRPAAQHVADGARQPVGPQRPGICPQGAWLAHPARIPPPRQPARPLSRRIDAVPGRPTRVRLIPYAPARTARKAPGDRRRSSDRPAAPPLHRALRGLEDLGAACARIRESIETVIEGKPEVVRAGARPCCSPRATCSSRTCPASARRCSPRRWPGRSTARSGASSSPPTCCPATSPASASSTRRRRDFEFTPGRGVRQHRARRRDQPRLARRRSRPCWSAWRSARSPSTAPPTSWPRRSW